MPDLDPRTPQLPPDEVIEVKTRAVACDGGDGPLGHPMIYMPLAPGEVIQCPYCSRRYRLAHGAVRDGGH